MLEMFQDGYFMGAVVTVAVIVIAVLCTGIAFRYFKWE